MTSDDGMMHRSTDRLRAMAADLNPIVLPSPNCRPGHCECPPPDPGEVADRLALTHGADALAMLSDLEWSGRTFDPDTFTSCGLACPACDAPELAADPKKNGTHADGCKLLALLRAAGLRP